MASCTFTAARLASGCTFHTCKVIGSAQKVSATFGSSTFPVNLQTRSLCGSAGAERLELRSAFLPSSFSVPKFASISQKQRSRALATMSAADGAKKQALISLSDKTDLALLGKGLTDLGYTLVSTGGTATALEKEGLSVTRVEELTSFPEMLDGRVKTLHPAVHGGILARRGEESHMAALQQHGIGLIDVVVVNLYPFYTTVTAAGGTSFENGVENIDIGGPAMIRAAAKNHEDVLVVVDPADYAPLLALLRGKQEQPGGDATFRRRLAWKAFQHVASYDTVVAEWLWKQSSSGTEWEAPPAMSVPLTLHSSLRYGENPHQKAAFYVDNSLSENGTGGIATSVQHHGKEMSYNNYLDSDAAWNCVSEFKEPTCVVVKHTNPCGVASSGSDLLEAYRQAVRADPISAFGGIVAFNVPVTEELARELREFRSPTDGETRMFYEIVVAPAYTEKGLEVAGGWLLQDADDITGSDGDVEFKVVTEKQPSEDEIRDVKFAWLCCKHVKSNAITAGRLLGMGSGQPNRVKSCEIALEKAGEEAKGAALASDAFFPFAWNDGVEAACKGGVTVIAQPGGSLRDQDAIDCCNKYGVAMLFTGVRHFRH
eukprot:jgi/Mesen1/9337/ME000061S08783